MPKLTVALSIILSSLFIVSCSKEESKEEKGISVTYKLISIEAHTVATTHVAGGQDDEKTITYSDYITKNNSGTIQFSGSNVISSNIAYDIDTTMRAYIYMSNSLVDSLEEPFQMTVPPSSSVATYKMVTSDSIYFNSGFMSMGSGAQQTSPSGGKIKIDGNKLYITVSGSQTSTQVQQGMTITLDGHVTGKVTLQRM